MKLRTKRGRQGYAVAAEPGTCARCTQPIRVGERITNELGKFAAHRACVRAGVVMERERTAQVSAGWGSSCLLCGQPISKPERWRKYRTGVAHDSC